MGLVILIGILVNIPAVQNFLVREVTTRLSAQLHTEVSIKHVDFRLFNSMQMEGTLVKDLKGDTLLYAGNLQVRITDWFFFQDKPIIKYVGLEDAQFNLTRTQKDSIWNYQFIIDAFSSPPDTTKKVGTPSQGISLDLKKIDFQNIRFNQVDAWVGEDMRVYAKRIYLDAKNLDIKRHNIDIQELTLHAPHFIISDYASSPLRHRRPRVKYEPTGDTALRWNGDNWKLLVKEINITDGVFGVDNPDDTSAVVPGYFAPNYFQVS